MNNHGHQPELVEQIQLQGGFSFHPKLAEWLIRALKLSGDEMVTVHEAGCTEESCPVEETILGIKRTSGEMVRLKIGRRKDQISKNDLFFAIQKQIGPG